MKPKIKYRLEIWGTTVVMQILEMDERFVCDSPYSSRKEYLTQRLNVISSSHPSLTYNSIYVYGMNGVDDLEVLSIHFKTKQDALEYAQNVHDSLLGWAANWEGFAEDYKANDPVEVLREYRKQLENDPELGKQWSRAGIVSKCMEKIWQSQKSPKPTLHRDGSIFTIQ